MDSYKPNNPSNAQKPVVNFSYQSPSNINYQASKLNVAQNQ